MKAADFTATPDDLLASAIRFGEHLAGNGWRVRIEPFDLAYPRTPVFVVSREHTTTIVEVQSTVEIALIEEWARYARTCGKDTRVLVAVGSDDPDVIGGAILERLRSSGVGLLLVGTDGPYEVLPPKDLALQLELPEVPEKLRPILGRAYDLFDRGEWREGFEHACTRFEQESRKYLKARVLRGGATFISAAGSTKTYTSARIGKMTLGQLAQAFGEMRSPNLVDSRLGQCLKEVNPERVTAAHYKGAAAAREKKLRGAVARHMFIVVNGLCYAKGISR